ncbi:tRNA (adenosine(37)-N6)-threonylcarbamoyltransferase complex dimerization subunit type 1 TsaB [Nakamurella antarctica]|uniref:tRNA (adenosine(37)-N6)-threonylcarbamoyltransferase complex dimerization subunit type 1 TsaB n=1 Tax=Nakamurella antarctica TaxID=1902245 RepID=UPI0013DE2225|nr:tRNA (adenosine(37)-N6)-threonylcarbamoyltransferase complex dimerization subunit type 1 TsaB [Nakamurella antarctica]
MLALAMDTSTPLITLTLAEIDAPPEPTAEAAEVRFLGHAELDNAFAHAEQLIPLAKQCLAEASVTLADLGAIVVGIGPGPFTGLRVGIATGTALGDGLGIGVYGVPSHRGLAVDGPAGDFLVVTDARRKEVFLTVFHPGGTALFGPVSVTPAAVPQLLADNDVHPEFIVGPGAGLLEPFCDLPVHVPTRDLGFGLITAVAADIAAGRTPGPLTPLYLRRPDATEPSGKRKSVLGR